MDIDDLGFHEEEEGERGLHIAVVDRAEGTVTHARSFDTYKSSVKANKFIKNKIPEGSIVCIACKDDCITSLSTEIRDWLTSLGSKEINNVEYR